MWSKDRAYLPTGLLPALYPPPNDSAPRLTEALSNVLQYTPLGITDTWKGQAALTLGLAGGLWVILGMALRP